jgi:DNA polymerase III subunit alpha
MPEAKPLHYGGHDVSSVKVAWKAKDGGPALAVRRRPTGNRKPMRFVSLHHHSTYSYMDGYQLPEAHVRRAMELNMSHLAMTEHGNIDSHVALEKACDEMGGPKPLFGCEVYMPTGPQWMDGAETQSKHHLTLLAKDAVGYRNLLTLVSGAWRDFYYEPVVTWAQLVAHKAGLFVLSGCQGSLLCCATVGGKGIPAEEASYRRGLRVARLFARTFGTDSYLIEVQAFPELETTRRFNAQAGRIARAVGCRLVATMDCHYTLLEEREVQQILHNLRPGEKRTLEQQVRDWGYTAQLCVPPNDASIYRKLRATGLSKAEAVEAMVSTEEVAQSCTAVLPKQPMVQWPGGDAVSEWRRRLKAGWRRRGCHQLRGAERMRYLKQLRHEMDLIEGKRYVDYFLLVADGVVFMKDQGIPVGPARGSAAGSLAAWLLRITEVNPLRNEFEGLLRFDRFIDVTREDLPDVDLDFPPDARPALRRFYVDMLGEDCVGNVGTFTIFKNKLAVDDVARVFNVPKYEVETLKNYLIERSSGDLRASSTIEDTVDQFPQAAEIFEKYPDLKKAQLIEGNVKGVGVHAAGLVLSNQAITNYTTTMEREVPKGSGNVVQVVALDKWGAARQGLLKMDFLGLNTMGMLWSCAKRLGMPVQALYDLPLDDPEVYAGFQRGDLMGIFQFEGRSTRYVTQSIRPEKFSEIMDCIALCRPGPILNGAASAYAATKAGRQVAPIQHPLYERLTSSTKGQLVYQEQILALAREVGGFNPRGVAEIRGIISRKKGEQLFYARRQQFLDGAAERGVPEVVADAMWTGMATSGAYSFNAAHCASYALIGYWTMWFKVHHPAVFFAACLHEATGNAERTHDLLRDADKHGLTILPPHLEHSEPTWGNVGTKVLRAGLRQVRGLGAKKSQQVIAWRDQQWEAGRDTFQWEDLLALKGFGKVTVGNIVEWVDSEDPFGAFKLGKDIAAVQAALAAGTLGPLPAPTHTAEGLVSGVGKVVWLGTLVAKPNIQDIFELSRARGRDLDPATVRDAHLTEQASMTCTDVDDRVVVKVDRWRYPRYREMIFGCRPGLDLLLVEGIRPSYASSQQLNVRRMWVIDPDE